MRETDLLRFRTVVAGALQHLEARRQEVNDLNVFPVADGDTGDNMALTLHAVLAELDRLVQEAESGRDVAREEIVEAVARAALLGARGNSGVILSQLIRGAAEELASRPGELIDPVLVGAAMARASDRAYSSVRHPVEGTILTVVREMAHRVVSEVAHGPDPRLGPEADAEAQNRALADILEPALQAGQESVRRTPDLLPVLREAGVVDAGGYAVCVIFAGVLAALSGDREVPELEHHRAPPRVTHPEHASESYRYCTNFVVSGEGLDPAPWTPRLEALGDSVLVVGDRHTLKVHVHTDDPEAATALFGQVGEVSRLDVADMEGQVAERSARLGHGDADAPAARCGTLAVVSGAGLRQLYEGMGAYVLDGGQTLNPSTYELLAAIHEVPAEEVVVLPNSPNVRMAAERAAELSDKQVVVVPTRAQQAGLCAAVVGSPDRSAADNAAAMTDALEAVRLGAVAPAARADPQGRFGIGDAVGFVGEEIVAWGAAGPTLERVMSEIGGDGAEILTCIAGEGAPLDTNAVGALAPASVELELQDGGQPSWWWLLAAE